MPHSMPPVPTEMILSVALLLAVFGALWYQRYLALSMGQALLLGLLTALGASLTYAASASRMFINSPLAREVEYESCAFAAFMVLALLGLGMLAKVYRAWVLDKATDLERMPGAPAFRAWLGPMHIIAGVGFVASAYFALGWRPWWTGPAVLALLLVYPAFNCLISHPREDRPDEQAAEERRRVLALVESGKISAEDGAELLSALSHSYTAGAFRNEDVGISGNRRMMLLGSALVLVGFFLPWFTVNVSQIMRDTLNTMMHELLPGFGTNFPSGVVQRVSGGDIAHGLGWILMFLGIGVAVLPLVWPTRPANRPLQRGISFVALVAGTILLLYLFSGYVTSRGGLDLEIGLPLVMAGYAIIWIWAVREYVLPVRGAGLSSLAAAH